MTGSVSDSVRKLELELDVSRRENERVRGLLTEALAHLDFFRADPNVDTFLRRARCQRCWGSGFELRGGRGDGESWTPPYRVPCPDCQTKGAH